MKSYQAIDKHTIQTSIVHHVEYTLAKNRFILASNIDSHSPINIAIKLLLTH
jgi:hypothetical protein